MKKHFLTIPYMAIAAAIVFTFAGCDKILDKFSFNLDRRITFDLQKAPPVGNVTLTNLKMSIDLDSALAANGVDNYTVTNITPNSASLATLTDSTNLDAFDSVSVFVTSTTLPEARIAHKNGIPKGIMQVPLEMSTVNVAEYLKEKPATFKINATMGDSVKKPMTMAVDVVFRVEVQKK